MSNRTENEIVRMLFDNKAFEVGVAVTLRTLDKLKAKLQFGGKNQSLEDVEKQASKFKIDNVDKRVDAVKTKFIAFGSSAVEQIGKIVTKAGTVAGGLAKAFVLAPISRTFQSGISGITGSLDRFKQKLLFGGRNKALDEVQSQANKFSMAPVSKGIDTVRAKFGALQIAGIAVLTNIVNRAFNAGEQWVKSFTFGPVMDGLNEYKTNLQSIQTIQANTDQPLSKINASLQELNTYSDQTIYNFSEMAKNIGTFTAAGVDLKTATSSIKGIANLAALSGSTSEQAATAMYQLSQAISSGKVGLQDWNSVVNAGMGGKKFQTALATTAQAMGKLDDKAVSLTGKMKLLTINGKTFRESITAKPGEKPWLSSDVLVNTLATLDGRFSVTALRAAQTADGLRKYTEAQIKAKIATSRTQLEQKNGVKYTDAQFKSLMKLSDSSFLAATQVKTLGQVFDVAKETVGSGWTASFQSIFGTLGEATKTFTTLSGAINGFINRNAMARNKVLHDWKELGGRAVLIKAIGQIFKDIGLVLKPIGDAFHKIFPPATGKSLFALTNRFYAFSKRMEITGETAGKIKRVFTNFFNVFHNAGGVIHKVTGFLAGLFGVASAGGEKFVEFGKNAGKAVSEFIHHIGDAITKRDTQAAFGDISKALEIGFLAAFVVAVKKFLGGGIHINFGAGLIGQLSKTFDGLTGSLKALQTQIKAKTLAEIAISIGILSVSVIALSQINPEDMQNALTAMAEGFGELLATLSILGKIGGVKSALLGPYIAKTLTRVAAAVLILALAVKTLGKLDENQLKRGVASVGALLAMISLSVIPLSKGSAGLVRAGLGMILIATSMTVLYRAVKDFAGMKWGDIGKGLGAVAIALGVLALAMHAMPKGMVLQAVGLNLIATSLLVLYKAMTLFASVSWSTMLHGLIGVGAALGTIGLAMRAMPKRMLLQAVALVAIGIALQSVGRAVRKMGEQSFGTIAKGLFGLGAALGILAVGLRAMRGSLLGAAALLLAATAITAIVPALVALSKLSMASILKGLVGLAGAFGVFALAGKLLGKVVPGLLGFSVVLLAIGASIALAGGGIDKLGSGLEKISKTGGKGFAVIGHAIKSLILGIPALLEALALGIVKFVVVIAKHTPELVNAFGKIIQGVLKLILENAPDIAQAAYTLIYTMIQTLIKNGPKLVSALVTLIDTLLGALADNLPRLIQAGFDFIIDFLNGLADKIRKNTPKLLKAIFGLGEAIIEGLWNGMWSLVSWIWDKISDFFSWLWDKVLDFFGVHSPSRLAADLGKNIIKGIWNGITGLGSWLLGLVTGFFKGVWTAITAVFSGAVELGKNILRWIGQGVTAVGGILKDLAVGAVKLVWKGITAVFSGAVQLGKDILGWIGKGISAAAGGLVSLAKGAMGLVTTGVSTVLSHGASIGRSFMGIMGNAINESAGHLIGVASYQAGKARLAAQDAMNGKKARDIGFHFSEGLAQGIEDGKYLVIAKAESVANDSLAIAGSTMRIQSPSKVMYWMGQMFVHGLANGIANTSKKAVAESEVMGNDLIDSFNSIVSGLDASNMNVQPVISPVLDLTNVTKSAASLGGLFSKPVLNASLTSGSAADLSAVQRKSGQNGSDSSESGKETYIDARQYNTSPKALDTTEIYRLHKTQLSQVKAGLESRK